MEMKERKESRTIRKEGLPTGDRRCLLSDLPSLKHVCVFTVDVVTKNTHLHEMTIFYVNLQI